MAFTAISATDVDADSPITDTLMDLIRTNFNDHETRILTHEAIIGDYTVGDILIGSSPTERSETSDTLTKRKAITIERDGALRIKMSLKKQGGTNCDAWIYQNGSPVGVIQETASASYAVFSQDISGWSNGDTVEVWIARGGAGTSVEVKDFEIYANNPPHPVETYDV